MVLKEKLYETFFKRLISLATAALILSCAVTESFAGTDFVSEIKLDYIAREESEPSEFGYVRSSFIDSNGNTFTPNSVTTENRATALPSSYSLINYNRSTSVKDQGQEGLCWSFAANASAESNMITDGNASTNIDYSEKYIAWFVNGATPSDPNDPMYGDGVNNGTAAYDMGGNDFKAAAAMARWSGPVPESTVPYSTMTALPESLRYKSYAHLQNANMFTPDDISSVKQTLMKNGAVSVSYYAGGTYILTDTYCSYYQSVYGTNATNHAVTVVGWDDNFSKSNFAETAPANGAWLIKNSWGEDWGYNGYFWLSYYEPSIDMYCSYDMESNTNYGNVYSYDGNGWQSGYTWQGSDYFSFTNVFTAKDSSPLEAVGFYTSDPGLAYTLKIHTNISGAPTDSTVVYTQTGTEAYYGYHTVKLNKKISLTAGTKFAVELAYDDTSYYLPSDTNNSVANSTYYKAIVNGESLGYTNFTKANACIKAFTSSSAANLKPKPTAAAGDGQVTLTWKAVEGATNYSVYSNLNGKYTNQGTTNSTSKTIKGLTNGTKYGFLVKAFINGTWTPYTNADLVYATPYALTKPTVTATAGNGQVTLTWKAVAGATNYSVYSNLNGKYTNQGTTTATSRTITGLTNGTKYGFLVKALINGTWTPYTNADLVYATPYALTKPTVTAKSGDGQVTLTWKAVAGATNYSVYSNLNGKYTNQGTTTSTSKTITGLTNGTKYGFLVKALINGTWTPYTNADLVYATPYALTKPTVTATAGNGQVTLTWKAVAGATNYSVYSNLNGKYTNQGTTTSTSKTITGLTNGTKYGFLVKALINGTWTPYTNADLVYATPVAAAVKPVVTAKAGDGQVTLTWKAVPGATNYSVYSNLNGKYTNQGATNATSKTITGLTNGTKYGFLVKALINGVWTSYTNADLVYATPYALTKPTVTATAGNGQVTLTWKAIPGATNYSVYSNLNGKYTNQGATTATSKTITGLTNGTKYGFLVKALINGTWTSYTNADLVYATPKA